MMRILLPLLLCTAWNGEKLKLTEDAWLKILGKERYSVMRNKETEKAFLGEYVNVSQKGTYVCAGCENPLFDSNDKLHIGAGWPLFSKPIFKKNIYYLEDWSLGFKRYEVLCSKCDSHLGHVFKESPDSPLRYIINSIALIRKQQ